MNTSRGTTRRKSQPWANAPLLRQLLDLLRDLIELRHYRRVESDFAKALVHASIPARGPRFAATKAVPDRRWVNGPAQIGNDRGRVVDLVSGTDPARGFTGGRKPRQIIGLPLLRRQLDTIVVLSAISHC